MVGGVQGWLFDPVLSEAQKERRKKERQEEDELIRCRSGPKSQWCECEICEPLDSPIDNLCCRKDETVLGWLSDDVTCITQHEGFDCAVMNGYVLDMVRHDILRYTKDKEKKQELMSKSAKSNRFVAYRNFVSWINSGRKLGKSNRVRIPACVVHKMRQKWPEQSGNYTGFKLSDEEHLDYDFYRN
jgi:hypothetical protein